MKSLTRHAAPILTATVIGAAMILGPVAVIDPSAAAASNSMLLAAAANSTPSPAPAPTPQTGGDPQVPYGPTLGFDSNNFDGNSLAY